MKYITFKMAMLGQFLHGSRNFEILRDRLGSGPKDVDSY